LGKRLVCVFAYFAFTSATLFGLARIAARTEAKAISLALLILALPYALPNDFAHGFEGALLSNALADQLERRYSRGLTFAALDCLAEPSMPYAYIFLLATLMLLHLYRHDRLKLKAVASFLDRRSDSRWRLRVRYLSDSV
jgi:hypothetical protein